MNLELITPEKAAEYLTHNHINRKLRQSFVKDLVNVITEGDWVITHQGIAFDTEGNLLDGQHRLTAVVQANRAVECYVTRGLPTETFSVIDAGLSRTLSDRIHSPKMLIEMIKLFETIVFGKSLTPSRFTHYIGSPLYKACESLMIVCPTTRKNASRVGIRLAAAVTSLVDKSDYPFEQYQALNLLDYDKMSSIVKSLCKRLDSSKLRFDNGGNAQLSICIIGMKLFNHSLKNNVQFVLPSDSEKEQYLDKIRSLALH